MPTGQVRFAESVDGLARLRREVAGWVDGRRRRDPMRMFHTQLTCLDDTLTGALRRLETVLADRLEGPVADLTEVYHVCRTFDRCAARVRRLWAWFADKFDQRDRPEYAAVLAAADEIAWSVHVEVMRGAAAAGLALPPAPAPLPFVDTLDAPEAVPRDEPPPQLRADRTDGLLRLLLARLPVPVVGLPTRVRWAPWTLVLLGHEVGHHIEHDLLPNGELVAEIGDAVSRAGGADDAPDANWYTWSHELFADLVGLAAMGPASVAALLPYELGNDAAMLDRGRGRYPAPAVRLLVLAELARRMALDLDGVLAPLHLVGHLTDHDEDPRPGPRCAVRRDVARAPAVAAALLRRLGGLGTLPDLIGFDAADFGPGGVVEQRAELLLRGDSTAGDRGPHVVREIASAGFHAWTNLPDPSDPEQAATLASTVLDAIVDAREEGTRAAAPAAALDLADELADALLKEPP